MKLEDTYGGTVESVSLPKHGTIRIGETLDSIDSTSLQEELSQYYGDRFRIVLDASPDGSTADGVAAVDHSVATRKSRKK